MIGKALLSGFWECPECLSLARSTPFLILDPSHRRFLLSHHFSCYTALLLLASKCFMIVSCYALMARSMWSRGSWRGDPWFPHSAVLLHSLDGMAMWFLCFCVLFCLGSATPIPELIQCYHLTLIISLWTGPPITFHFACFWGVLFGLFGCFCVVFCLFAFGVVSLFAVFLQWIVTAAGLRTGPITFVAPIPDGGYMYALIS